VNEVRNRLEALGGSLASLPLDDAQSKVAKLQREYKLTDDQLFSFIDNSGEFKNSLVAQATELGLTADKATLLKLATGEMAGVTDQQTQALSELSGSAQDASVDIDDLKATIEGFGSAQLDVNAATRDFEAAVDDLSASVTENGSTLDVATSQGRANQAALDDIAKSTLGLSSATLTQTGSQQQASAAIANGRQRLIEALAQFGITGAAAEQYADKLGLIPSNISTAAQLTGVAAAEAQINQLARDRAVSLNIRVNEQISAENRAGGAKSTVGGVPFAEGGPVRGPGTGTSDSIRAWLSNGEHIWTAREVAAAGGHGNVMALRREILGNRRAPGFASGGPVGSTAPVRYAAPSPFVLQTSAAPAVREGDRFYISSPADPVAVAQSVARRQQGGRV